MAGWASGRIGLRCACPVGFLRCKNPVRLSPFRATKNATLSDCVFFKVAGWTRLELATSCVTGRRSNQLNYHPSSFEMLFRHIAGLLSTRFLKFFIFALPVSARFRRAFRGAPAFYIRLPRGKKHKTSLSWNRIRTYRSQHGGTTSCSFRFISRCACGRPPCASKPRTRRRSQGLKTRAGS